MTTEEMHHAINKAAESLDKVRYAIGDDISRDAEQLEAIADQLRSMLVRWVHEDTEPEDISDILY